MPVMPPPVGHVSLVGAGPGDPDLLTRRAVARLRAADLVLYDALVDERVLPLARRAQRFYVGKRDGRHALTQQEIHTVMIRAALRGRRIVRLKGGDPFVFGRGGEEAQALQAAGIPFDIVPGVSSVLAGPALAGIPVTHRSLAASLLVTTGHDIEAFAAQIGHLPVSGLTLVVAMGYNHRAAIAAVLIDAGWQRETPAAIVVGASTPGQQVWRGSLAQLAGGAGAHDGEQPALLVIGDVAALDLQSSARAGATVADDASGGAATERDAGAHVVRRGER